jgi:hypothetical protein
MIVTLFLDQTIMNGTSRSARLLENQERRPSADIGSSAGNFTDIDRAASARNSTALLNGQDSSRVL